jgi:hypothetical protein
MHGVHRGSPLPWHSRHTQRPLPLQSGHAASAVTPAHRCRCMGLTGHCVCHPHPDSTLHSTGTCNIKRSSQAVHAPLSSPSGVAVAAGYWCARLARRATRSVATLWPHPNWPHPTCAPRRCARKTTGRGRGRARGLGFVGGDPVLEHVRSLVLKLTWRWPARSQKCRERTLISIPKVLGENSISYIYKRFTRRGRRGHVEGARLSENPAQGCGQGAAGSYHAPLLPQWAGNATWRCKAGMGYHVRGGGGARDT